jgi:hypothetical protein
VDWVTIDQHGYHEESSTGNAVLMTQARKLSGCQLERNASQY